MSKNFKAPPPMREGLPYDDWKKEVKIWKSFTDLEKSKQGGALYLSLEGRTRDAVLAEVDPDQIKTDTGIDIIIKALDKLFLKDKTESGFEAFDSFIKFRRPHSMSIEDYVTEFNIKYSKLKCFQMVLPDGVLAYALLTCANLSPEQEQLARATCQKLTYKDMKQQIERIHASPKREKEVEPFYSYDASEAENGEDEECYETEEYPQQSENALFTLQNRTQTNFPKVNMPDEFGKPTRCSFCHSIYHYVRECTHAQSANKARGPQSYRRPQPRGRGGPRRGFYEKRL